MKTIRCLVVALTGIFLSSCDLRDSPGNPTSFSEDEVRKIGKLSPLPEIPPSPTNRFADNPDAAQFGKTLFFEKRLSVNGKISCATCHDPEHGLSDGKTLSQGLGTTKRHSQALWNVAYQRWFFWDGRADSLWSQSVQPMHKEEEMGATSEHLLEVVSGGSQLRKGYETVFGPLPGKEPSMDHFVSNLGKAFEAFERRIISKDSSFDQFAASLGAENSEALTPAMSESAKRGLKLFVGRGQCILCHSGPNFSDGEFHNIGLPQNPDLPRDLGRFGGIRELQADRFNGLGKFSDGQDPESNIKLRYLVVKMNNLGEFKTPTLRNVAQTAPYMHDGRFATLDEVLDFYSKLPGEPPVGHREETLLPMKFSNREKTDLIAFLESLTGAPLDESLIGE